VIGAQDGRAIAATGFDHEVPRVGDMAARGSLARRGSGFSIPPDEQNCAFLATLGRKLMHPWGIGLNFP
jgi:hypothetical protein